jgi:hypothetical protein
VAYDIWELDDTPGVAVVAELAVTPTVTPQPKLNFWSLAIIILAVWLVVKEL